MRVFIGSIDYETTVEQLTEFLEHEVGPVENVYFAHDKATGRFRGFAFVTFAIDGDGERAIELLHGVIFNDRKLVVKEALPRPAR
jgi:RNA recognition motif-containing protein